MKWLMIILYMDIETFRYLVICKNYLYNITVFVLFYYQIKNL
jgi:hypothetical protein